jgi:hypothetical protein
MAKKIEITEQVKPKRMRLTKQEADPIFQKARNNYRLWRRYNKLNNKGFFVVYNDFKETNILSRISGNACRLYLYLGIVSKNETGESWHSNELIAEYFNCDIRSVKRWFVELQQVGLINRVQKGAMRRANTFLLPYPENYQTIDEIDEKEEKDLKKKSRIDLAIALVK